MKKIQDNYKNLISLKVSLLQPATMTTAIVPLQPQEEKVISGWERLVAQTELINQMAKELEGAILELKTIACTLKTQSFLKEKSCNNICEYFVVGVPCVKQKSDESFILTMRKVDLFRAEREAAQLAQQLRQQTKKRLTPQRHRKNKSEANTTLLLKRVLINKS
ncbi:hypothetical protein [aff. Roholtiella sp. LEGE 12411]|uniref:hypothetical protein n=1 Tax=aff. Roholtiella sp. LEGE 12411 TaxID=1828822 RepID=UPI00187EDA79|nr:hypothetical protein [aff. Roholtiella sp. LEGE 12411]MBE9035456.1 hypothetical protein [aff. Roholtiella sp. LEGE 12411]